MGLPDASVTQRLWWTFRNWGDGVREGEYWIAYSEYAKPQQNRQVNNAHFLLVWGTFPTMTVWLCGLQGSALSRDQDFGISLSGISLFILVLWPWVHGAGVDSCLCRSEYLKLNNQRILGHVVIWYWGQFCGIFFLQQLSCMSFMLFGIHVCSLYWKEAPWTGTSAKLALQWLWGGWNVAGPVSNYGWSCAILTSLLDFPCPQLCVSNILVTIRCNLLGCLSRLLAPPAKGYEVTVSEAYL